MGMTIRNLLGIQGSSKLEVEILQVNDTLVSNSEYIENTLNDYFRNIAQALALNFKGITMTLKKIISFMATAQASTPM